jgi:nucleoside 2-deoxyribosyltransferase
MQEVDLDTILRPRRLSSGAVYELLKKQEIHVYLAGPISFAEDLQDYRRQLREGLLKISPKFKIHDPWEREQALGPINSNHLSYEEKKVVAEEVITADLKDIASCDMLLAYMFRIGVGSSMEIFFASRILGKPVIVVYTPEDETEANVPLWLIGHANLIFRSKKGLYSWLRKALEDVENGNKA